MTQWKVNERHLSHESRKIPVFPNCPIGKFVFSLTADVSTRYHPYFTSAIGGLNTAGMHAYMYAALETAARKRHAPRACDVQAAIRDDLG